jgi:glutamate-1-semialdehyde 2,1-aminomutase
MKEGLQYEHETSASQSAYEKAKLVIPGGVQGNIKFYEPYPLSFQSAIGAWLKDLDGNDYVDYLLSFGALILGHGHPVVKKAVNEVWDTYGTSSFGVPYPLELEMVQKIRSVYPSIEEIRFTNSGLEATLLAIRLGMAYTGRPSIAKFAGHYHGGHEHVLVSTHAKGNSEEKLAKDPESLALPDYYLEHTEILPFHDIDLCEQILRQNKDKIGVVIMEPLQSGYIPVDAAFMIRLREVTKELGIVLVFDEVKTGFRIRLGGAQEYYGVQPDLTALGKVLGGGFPVGAVGGKKEILELASPTRSLVSNEIVFHSGTFNGNPISLLAGLRTIEFLQANGNYDQLLKTTKDLRTSIEEISNQYGLPIRTVGAGSIFNLVFSDNDFSGASSPLDVVVAEKSKKHQELRRKLDFYLMKHGVYSKPFNRFSVSVAHDEDAIAYTLDAFEKSCAALKASLSL